VVALMLRRALSAFGAGVALLAAGGARAQEGAVPRGGTGAIVTEEQPADAPKPPVIKEPELLEFVNAAYPPDAMKQGIEANVSLVLTIDKEGRVTKAESPEPVGNGFDEAAIAAAQQFRFKPATKDDKPIATKIRYLYKFTLTTVQAPPPPPPTTGNLVGRLRLTDTDAPVAGAELVLVGPDGKERRLTTNGEGRFRAEDVPPGAYKVRIALPGFDPVDSTEEVVAGDETDVTFRLSPESEGIEVVVRGERPPREVTRRTVERREIERIPGTSGDALRSIQSLPGVARPPGLAGLLIVRGSAPEDTQQFIDGAGVPIIYHFGGLSSVVPTELLERIDFYPGNFSARYGRAGGGIVDVALRSPDTRCLTVDGKPDPKGKSGCFHGLGQVDLIDGRVLVQGPLPMKNWSFAAGFRRSWLDVWLKPVLEQAGAGVTTAPRYYDYQLIAEHKSGGSRTSLRFYGSDDRVAILITDPAAQDPAFGGSLRFGTAFYRGQIVHESALSSKFTVTGELAVGKDAANFALGTFFFKLRVVPITTRYELSYRPIKGAKINVGLDFEMAAFDAAVRFPQPPRPGEPDPGPYATRPPVESKNSGFGFRPGWYGEVELEPIDRLRIVPGARVDYARDSGHGDFSPRITARADLIKGRTPEHPDRRRTTLKGGAGLFHQPPQYQETDEVFGTPNLYSNRFTHYTAGVEQELTRNIDIGVEGFYKDLDRMVSRAPVGAAYAYENKGTGFAYGAETLLKYRPDDRFFGWLAYTLSRSERRDAPGQKRHLFQYDQTHNLTVLGSYRLGRGWEFGARFRLVSGNLETPVVGPPSLPALYAADAGSYAPLQGEPFSERLPLFHQLDIRIDKRWQLKNARLSTYLDVQNVYNHAAQEATVYNFDFTKKSYQTGIPIIPSLGLRLEI
jgi:TonB family protein